MTSQSIQPADFQSPRQYVKHCALQKALSLTNRSKNWLLTADTIVVHEDTILEKPKDKNDATTMLSTLSNTTHCVITSFCLFHPILKKCYVRSVKSFVTFGKLTKKHIEDYIHQFNPYDKAGSYGIQELPAYFNAHVKGSKYNVIGLPIYQVRSLIKHIQG